MKQRRTASQKLQELEQSPTTRYRPRIHSKNHFTLTKTMIAIDSTAFAWLIYIYTITWIVTSNPKTNGFGLFYIIFGLFAGVGTFVALFAGLAGVALTFYLLLSHRRTKHTKINVLLCVTTFIICITCLHSLRPDGPLSIFGGS